MSAIYTSVLVYNSVNVVQSVATAHKAQLLQTKKLIEQQEIRQAQNQQNLSGIETYRTRANVRSVQSLSYQQYQAATARNVTPDDLQLSHNLTAQTTFKTQQIAQKRAKHATALVKGKTLAEANEAAKAYQTAQAISPTNTRAFSGSGFVILDRIVEIDIVV